MHLFFDFDDTISDHGEFGRQYVAHLSGILAREMGGSISEWSEAIVPALAGMVERYLSAFQRNPLAGYNNWLCAERSRVVADAFVRAGKPIPDADAAHDLALHLQEEALRGCNALYAGADSGLRALADSGFTIYLASSQESAYLRGALTGAPAYHVIREFFGPDLVDCAKEGPEFYTRIFEVCEIRANDAIVIDDQVMCLEWAYEVGAKVVQSRVRENPDPIGADLYFEDWKELPAIIDTLAGTGKLSDDVGIIE